jgi:RNA polymerase sigma factor (sigma-70 family)
MAPFSVRLSLRRRYCYRMDVYGCDLLEWRGPASGLTSAALTEYHQPGTKVMIPDAGPPNTLESTLDLLARVREGDRDALDRLFTRCLPALSRWARGRLPAAARGLLDTQDLVQDTVLSSLRHLDHFESRHEGALQAYLRQAVLNRIRDEARRFGRRPPPAELTDSQPSTAASPLDIAIGREGVERYEAALQRLRPSDREAIIGRIEMQHDYQELAAILGKPNANAARVAVTRALARLMEQFDEA